ncbi:MAG: hypothetical protein AB1782_14720 [Cyanobacteriota bacterium]
MKLLLLTSMLLLPFLSLQAFAEPVTCKVDEVIDGNTFTCIGGQKIYIWGIDAPNVAPLVSDEEAQKNNGNKAKEYLTSYIKGKDLICHIKGMRKEGIVAQCINDLKVKSYDIAVPLFNSGYVKELEDITKGYYRKGKYPRGL